MFATAFCEFGYAVWTLASLTMAADRLMVTFLPRVQRCYSASPCIVGLLCTAIHASLLQLPTMISE